MRRVSLASAGHVASPDSPGNPVVGVIGAGNYGSRVLVPAFARAGARLDTVVTSTGASGVHHGSKNGFSVASTDVSDVLENPRIDTVVIATRHDTHASLVTRALSAGKNVFVEKPLALTLSEVDEVERAWESAATPAGVRPSLLVGFNRRFSPLAVELKRLLRRTRQPKAFAYTCNAGMIPPDHWTQDPAVGGGRILGEACHFVDFLRYLADSPIRDCVIRSMGRGAVLSPDDKAVISLRFEDGSIGTILYFANGGKAFPKERVEVFSADAVLQLNNFVALRGYGWKGFGRKRLWRQDKGQSACAAAFVDAIRHGSTAPIEPSELFEVARVSIRLAEQQRAEG
jgi:predicted dehydrogenase